MKRRNLVDLFIFTLFLLPWLALIHKPTTYEFVRGVVKGSGVSRVLPQLKLDIHLAPLEF